MILEANLCRAQNLIDKTWRRMSDTFMLRVAEGRSLEGFPDLSEAAAARTSDLARSAISEIDALDTESLPHQLALTLKLLRFQLGIETQALGRYWLVQDTGMSPAMFVAGPYGGGYLLSLATKAMTDHAFDRPGDCDRYLALVEDYAHLIDQMRSKIVGQAQRGIRIPRPALAGARAMISAQAATARKNLAIHAERVSAIANPRDFADRVAARIQDRVARSFAELLDCLDERYASQAPEAVGIAQFKGGSSVYESLVAEHLSISMPIDAIHRAGHERMKELEEEMSAIRGALGFSNRDAFHHFLSSDTAWVARSEDDLEARFEAALRRVEPRIETLFLRRPAARYRIARLDPALEAGMTYGYYQMPLPSHPDGVYYFNGSRLSERTLAIAASLIYHELVPGHHFHVATQRENELLHPLRQNSWFSAFNEGWAEYTATLAGEVGLYPDPCEKYGRLLMDVLLTCRLVVDTGMNALGWTLDEARHYLRERTIMSDAEVCSETLRYSTDIPAQALAYKFGEIKMFELRSRAQDVLGERFDLRAFHEAVIGSGGMPLEVLDWHVNYWLAAQGA